MKNAPECAISRGNTPKIFFWGHMPVCTLPHRERPSGLNHAVPCHSITCHWVPSPFTNHL